MIDARNRFRVVNSVYEGMRRSKKTIVLSDNKQMAIFKMNLFIESIPNSVEYKAIRGDMKVELMGVEVIFKSNVEELLGIEHGTPVYIDDL